MSRRAGRSARFSKSRALFLASAGLDSSIRAPRDELLCTFVVKFTARPLEPGEPVAAVQDAVGADSSEINPSMSPPLQPFACRVLAHEIAGHDERTREKKKMR